MQILCLDLEGVLIPEIWVGVAEQTGIKALGKTTRDIPDYDELMHHRLEIMAQNDVDLVTIQSVIGRLAPLPGALDFLNWARQRYQVAIISDTFYEFASPLMAQLGWPMLLCHRLRIHDGRIVGYRLRQEDPKRHSVEAFQGLGYQVLAAGDSYNDIPMLQAAQQGFLFCAPEKVQRAYPQFPLALDYEDLKSLLSTSEE